MSNQHSYMQRAGRILRIVVVSGFIALAALVLMARNLPTVRAAAPATTLSSGLLYTCFLQADGTVACWGNNEYGQATPWTPGPFVQVSAGGYHTCGIKSDGSVT